LILSIILYKLHILNFFFGKFVILPTNEIQFCKLSTNFEQIISKHLTIINYTQFALENRFETFLVSFPCFPVVFFPVFFFDLETIVKIHRPTSPALLPPAVPLPQPWPVYSSPVAVVSLDGLWHAASSKMEHVSVPCLELVDRQVLWQTIGVAAH
jgi:hypothetical protein